MASESIKKVQAKLFRSQGPHQSQQQEGRASPSLEIHIPKVEPLPTPNPPQKVSKLTSDGYSKPNAYGRPYHQRVSDILGCDYQGVERYRLVQDEKKERHWKRWGPYLSERQWVSGNTPFVTPPIRTVL
jgi:hypothetical protein